MKTSSHPMEDVLRQIEMGFQSELIDQSVWIAPGAVVTGQVHIAAQASVWYGAVLRGDVAPIYVGRRSNIQDGAIIHVNYQMPTTLGEEVVLGHGAVVHAAKVHDGSLIAIRAVVLSGATIGEGSIVGAGAVVAENAVVPPRSVVLGVPGRVVRRVTDQDAQTVRELANRYVAYSRQYLECSSLQNRAESGGMFR